ncbi:MAG: thermonuclease family protein [Kiritimatiellaceae bacterium]|nr:thermonuclease family protein [Kiritimatiellaceae bacterium]
MKKTLCFLLPLLFTLVAFGYPAKVVGISDGDTCTVLTADNQQVKIRLAGIDTPEKSQAFGTKAKQALSDKVFGQTVEVKEQSKDRYGRTVADLYLGARWINLEMVAEGWAWHYKAYSKDSRLSDAEQAARSRSLGLWADKAPQPPWEFRADGKAETRAQPQTSLQQPVEGGYWLNTNGNTRHNSRCKYFNNTKNGRPCSKDEGKACGTCGG